MNRQDLSGLERLKTSVGQLCQRTIDDSPHLGVEIHPIGGATVLDFGTTRLGTIAGGVRLAEICLGGLATVGLQNFAREDLPLPLVTVATDEPLLACIGCQYAGWPFQHDQYFSMCSGTARVNHGREEILQQYGMVGQLDSLVAIFESDQRPNPDGVAAMATACGVPAESMVICIARTASLPGSIQVVARSVETTLHKLHELKFDLATIQSATGSAPLPPIAAKDLISLGWTNDSILYGGLVHLWVDTDDDSIEQVIDSLPSNSSADFGRPFLEIFEHYDRDFYKIDKSLFSPAQVAIFNIRTGRTFVGGQIRSDLLRQSFGLP